MDSPSLWMHNPPMAFNATTTLSRPLILGFALLTRVLGAQAHASSGLGTVRFETSCAPAARTTFGRGVALLHSFEFPGAIRTFNEVLSADSTCTMAYWGLALSAWGNPFAAGIKPDPALERGSAAAERGRALGRGTERERAYLEAAGRLFDDFRTTEQRARVVAYRDAMADVAARYPDDDEASIFYALALAFSADPGDKSYEPRRKAGAILERL